ncbi:hypothetical protein DFH09DRAFT_804584, partial [Mycena vulgaris]
LPYEVTSRNFLYCLPPHRRIRPRQTHAPLQLTQICGQWRAVPLATPEIWNSMCLEFLAGPYEGLSELF